MLGIKEASVDGTRSRENRAGCRMNRVMFKSAPDCSQSVSQMPLIGEPVAASFDLIPARRDRLADATSFLVGVGFRNHCGLSGLGKGHSTRGLKVADGS